VTARYRVLNTTNVNTNTVAVSKQAVEIAIRARGSTVREPCEPPSHARPRQTVSRNMAEVPRDLHEPEDSVNHIKRLKARRRTRRKKNKLLVTLSTAVP
jgi:hypothetical protein